MTRNPIKFATLVALTLLAAVSANSQSKDRPKDDISNFSGVWKLASRQTTPRILQETHEFYFLEITASGVEFKVERRYKYSGRRIERSGIYFTDKRGEVNKSPTTLFNGSYEQKSKTVLKGGRVVIRWNYKSDMGWIDVTETYSLSNDGKKLVYESFHRNAVPGAWETSQRDTFLRVL